MVNRCERKHSEGCQFYMSPIMSKRTSLLALCLYSVIAMGMAK